MPEVQANRSDARREMTPDTEQTSLFQRIADRVSFLMGTPGNIIFWLIIVVAWTAIFAFGIVGPNAQILPSWFTGPAFNFPLNLVTTVAELFIGFLVGAASNRSERHLENTLSRIEELEQSLAEAINQNTEITREVKEDTLLLDEIHEHVTTLTPHSGRFDPYE